MIFYSRTRSAGWPVAPAFVWMLAVALPTLALAGELKAGWTPELLVAESADCSKTLVEAAWQNTKREQGIDAALPLTEEIRKQLEPQIAAMKTLCECAVRAGAERYTKAEADNSPTDLDNFVTETVNKGTCNRSP